MKRILLFVALSMLMKACVSDPTEVVNTEHTPTSKIVNPNATPAEGLLMVRLADEGDTSFLSEITAIEIAVEPLFHASRNRESSLDRWLLLSFDRSVDVTAIAELIAADSRVERVEYDVVFKRPQSFRAETPVKRAEPTRAVEYPFDDPELPWQWNYHNDGSLSADATAGADINLLNAWKYTAGNSRIIVGVIDGGIMADHPDLADNMWVNEAEMRGLTGVDDDANGYVDDIHGWNFVTDSATIVPDTHGTHVGGTISAVNNNGFAVCGVAGGTGNGDGVRLMSLQIFDGDDSCFSHQIARAFEYAADNGAILTNNSWGYSPNAYISDDDYERYESIIKSAINYFENNARLEGVMEGGLAIFAAGNETHPNAAYPGAYHSNVCVSAIAANYTATYYTNYGPGCNIAAPGGDLTCGTIMGISSTSVKDANGYGYEYQQGTSMATPHVTGCAALGISYAIKQGYTLTADRLRTLLLSSVHDINKYQEGYKERFNFDTGAWEQFNLEPYKYKLGGGYIDAHLLLMQLDGTPCLYLRTGEQTLQSLDSYFGDDSESLSYDSVEMSVDVRSTLGINTAPTIENGMLKIKCTKPGIGRIKVRAIVGGTQIGGGDKIGGMIVEREFEIVVRGSVASNGGWL